MRRENIDFWAKLTIVIFGAVAFSYVLFKYVLILVFPFLIAWAVAFAVRPLAKKIRKAVPIPERVLRLVIALLFISLGTFLLFFGVYKILAEGWRILTVLSESDGMNTVIEALLNPKSLLSRFLPEGVADGISGAVSAALDGLIRVFTELAAGFVASVPRLFLFIMITLIAVVYFAFDLERINSFVSRKLPRHISGALVSFKNDFFSVGIRYVKAYLTVMLIVFSIALTGLLLLGVEYALVLAVVISVLDILPAVGVGTVLVPWGAFQIFFGSRALGFGLIVLFLIVELVRQFIEPRIVGKNLGIHPVVSLLLLWSAYSLFGILGIITVPALAVVIYALFGKNNSPKVDKLTVKKADGA